MQGVQEAAGPVRSVFAAILCAILPLLASCTADGPGEPLSSARVERAKVGEFPAAIIRTNGKVRDLDAAVNRALDDRGLAVLVITERETRDARHYELIGIRDEVGWILITHPPIGDRLAERREIRPVEIACRIGDLGDPEREHELVRAIAGQVEELSRREK